MGLMTGQYQQRFGIYDNIYGEDKVQLFLRATLLPALFQKAGCRTALVGKWHLSGHKKLCYKTAEPLDRGFDEFVGIRGGDASFWKGTPIFRGGKQLPAPEYLTDLWGNEACAFIDHNRDQPFPGTVDHPCGHNSCRVAPKPHTHGKGLLAMSACLFKKIVQVKSDPGQIAKVFHQGKKRKKDRHGR